MATLVAYLSNETVHDPCTRTEVSTDCGFPLTALGPGGVLITWRDVSGPPGQDIANQPGTAAVIGGHAARIDQPDAPTASCRDIGASREIDVAVRRSSDPTHDELWVMTGCFAGLGAAGTAVDTALAMARSLRFNG